jgi:hypothetical protein
LADASKEKKTKRKEVVIKMQMIINVILSSILVVAFLLPALGVSGGTWMSWVLGIAAALALVLSFFTSGKK